ncbi:DUF3099 domain-containing protein [Phytoactinopolyspora halophila]|uniref:DUF3099 domain-containing protein n=1 Tax=Phytoactinopolyspora halophila TaxID=1981511 RepID=UPI001B8C82C7|nr:DUF3099 domain-containing protein [Phytoactinopolyspora halophila]
MTTAADARSTDRRSRQNRYLWMMGIRLACLPLAVVTEGWIRWVFIVGAVVLPYIAVVIANAAAQPSSGTIQSISPSGRPELPGTTHSDDPRDQNPSA